MDYYSKYLKYKTKYLELKKQFGGDKAFIKSMNVISLFDDMSEEMNKYFNPIHGMILCYSGYIKNNYHLQKNKFINTRHGNIIAKISKDVPGDVQPTNDIMILKPIDFGRYIALKYIYMNNNFFCHKKKKDNIKLGFLDALDTIFSGKGRKILK